MLKLLKTELWKAFHNWLFYTAILIGTILSLVYAIEIWREVMPRIRQVLEMDPVPWMIKTVNGFALAELWMGVSNYTVASTVFYMIWPLLTAMPYSWSYWKEKRDGVADQIMMQCGRKQYFAAKYLAVLISGGAVVFWTYLISFMMDATFLKMSFPSFESSAIHHGCVLSGMYFTHPYLYCILIMFICAFYGGVVACLSFLPGSKPRFQVVPMMTPYVLLMGYDLVLQYLRVQRLVPVSPLYLIQMDVGVPTYIFLIALALLIAISSIGGYFHIAKKRGKNA